MSAVSSVLERARTPGGRKAIRYSLVSVVSVGISQTALFLFFAILHWSAEWSNVAAAGVATVPSYYLNRRWAWGKTGRSQLWREIVPFWVLAFVGLGFSTAAVAVVESFAADVADSRIVQGLVINGASIAAYGVLWVVKFYLLNKVIFVNDPVVRDEIVA